MDPYLEQHWRDVHASLIIYIRDALGRTLPGDLRARVEERVVVESPDTSRSRSVYPDVRVIETAPARLLESIQGGVAIAEEVSECLLVDLADEPMTETYVEIIDLSSGRRVVTCIEVLSPTNKTPGVGQELYRRKQQEMLAADVNLVEIDLLRTGERVAAIPGGGQGLARPYLVTVRRGAHASKAVVYPVSLRERLPTIAVPLRPNDPEVPLNLQKLIEQCWANGGYDDIDYSVPPIPPLGGDDAQWAATLLGTRR
jgi:hypothetical protein